MQAFAALLDRLYYTHSTNDKAAVLTNYLSRTPDPDRGFAVGVIAGTVNFELFKRALVRDLVAERVDPVLLALSYDYVGEMSETVAHIWPRNPHGLILNRLPPLHEVIHEFQTRDKPQIREYLALLLDNMTPPERWALLKLGTSTLRIGMSARSVKHVLADFGGVSVGEIEEVWHAQQPPYLDLFAWLEKRGPKPELEGCRDVPPGHARASAGGCGSAGHHAGRLPCGMEIRRHPRADCIHAQRQSGVLPQRRRYFRRVPRCAGAGEFPCRA